MTAAVAHPWHHRLRPSGVASRELIATLGAPRSLVIKLVIPLVITVPLVAGHAPGFWAATLLTVLVAMVAAVGNAVSLGRSRQSGVFSRLALSPRAPARHVLGWAFASWVVDAAQMTPVIVLVGVAGGGGASATAVLALMTAATLLIGSVLGAAVSMLGAGVGELLIDMVIVLAPLLFIGGLFTGVATGGLGGFVASLDPFRYLHQAFIGALGGLPIDSDGAVVAAAAITAMVAVALLTAIAGRVVRR